MLIDLPFIVKYVMEPSPCFNRSTIWIIMGGCNHWWSFSWPWESKCRKGKPITKECQGHPLGSFVIYPRLLSWEGEKEGLSISLWEFVGVCNHGLLYLPIWVHTEALYVLIPQLYILQCNEKWCTLIFPLGSMLQLPTIYYCWILPWFFK